jgi:hypothetical protein
MNAHHLSPRPHWNHRLVFAACLGDANALAFPCDPRGHVPLDELDERARNQYFFARTVVGRDYRSPVVMSGA